MIKKYNQFINEGLRDKMVSKSDDDIKASLKKLDIMQWIREVSYQNLDDSFLPSETEIKDALKGLNTQLGLTSQAHISKWVDIVRELKLGKKFFPTKDEIKSKLDIGDWIELASYKRFGKDLKPSTEDVAEYLSDKTTSEKLGLISSYKLDKSLIPSKEDMIEYFEGASLLMIEQYMKLLKLDDSYLPSDDILRKKLDEEDIQQRLSYINSLNLRQFLPPDDEIKDYLSQFTPTEQTQIVSRYGLDKKFIPRKNKIRDNLLDDENMKNFWRSFNRKATIVPGGDDTILLKSYDTIVAEYNYKTKKLKVNGWYSSTTQRQINGFINYCGGDRGLSKKEMEEKPTIKI